jgi:hypothetical protein
MNTILLLILGCALLLAFYVQFFYKPSPNRAPHQSKATWILIAAKRYAQHCRKGRFDPIHYSSGIYLGLGIASAKIIEALFLNAKWDIPMILVWLFISWGSFERLGFLKLLEDTEQEKKSSFIKNTEQGAAANP